MLFVDRDAVLVVQVEPYAKAAARRCNMHMLLLHSVTWPYYADASTVCLSLQPFDERLLPEVAGAVLEAAIASGVARLTDIDVVAYKRQLADLSIRMNF